MNADQLSVEEFTDRSVEPAVRGFLHVPAQPNGNSLVLTHGAGANCKSNLLTTLSAAFAEAGFVVLRFDLPFRQVRPFGPPFPTTAERDREGIRRAIEVIKQKTAGRIFAGGHSYGGRQTTMLIAEQPDLVEGLLLLSYPLHPPRKPEQLRTAHFPKLTRPALFVHGSRDAFGSLEEMCSALNLIPARHQMLEANGAGHELLPKKSSSDLPSRIVEAFQQFLGK
ncbi:MAG TPA: alpha/beta fold hydrolase [Candidatus Angelobacter sp.]|nr:alpha/beta fold hydrolase [Candidatus Angelobacter sp.]